MPHPPHLPVPQPPPLVRAGLLLLLPMVAVGFYQEGQRYDPGLLEFKQATAGLPLPATLHNLPRLGEVRRYHKENLYEYINGHAEFFIGAGFSGLTVVEYAPPGATQPALVADLFDMGAPLHAFGVLMDETTPQATPVAVGAMGFQSGRGVQFIQGRTYVKLAAFQDGLPLGEIAAALAAALPVAKGEGLRFDFPELGEVTATRFVKENYRGMPFLNNVLERTVRQGEKPLTLFLLTAPAEALTQVEQALAAFVQSEGMTLHPQAVGTEAVMVVEDPYEGTWFYRRQGARLLGVFAEPDPALLARIVDADKESGHGGEQTP